MKKIPKLITKIDPFVPLAKDTLFKPTTFDSAKLSKYIDVKYICKQNERGKST